MAGTAILRALLLSSRPSSYLSLSSSRSFLLFSLYPFPSQSPPVRTTAAAFRRPFCSYDPTIAASTATADSPRGRNRRSSPKSTVPAAAAKTNFSLDEASDSDSELEKPKQPRQPKPIEEDRSKKLPPPYDPFSKKPAIEEPEDPKNLQEIFHRMRTEGLLNNAVKMFDALSKDGLTHEALDLFAQIKDKGHMPDVVGHTAVIEAYANAGGQSKEALKTFTRMLASGVEPNAYTYAVLIRGLAGDGRLADAKKYVMEMMGKGMKPNARTYVAVFEAFAMEGKGEEGRELLVEMKGKGFAPDEKAVREVLKDRRGQVVRCIMSILFNK